MKKGIILIIALIIISIIPITLSENYVKVDSKVISALENQEKVRVIVFLNDESKEIKAAKDDIKNNIGNIRHDFGNSFSMEITSAELKELENNEMIKGIYDDPKIKTVLQQSAPMINATETWSFQVNGTNITGLGETVCIIDTGINYSHPALGNCSTSDFISGNCAKVIGGYDFGNDDNDPYDYEGHGTHVAGIVAANGSINGVAHDARIVAIKVFSDAGSASMSDLKAGIDWCIDNATKYNISVITMSLAVVNSSNSEIPYSVYCDSEYAGTLTDSINNAIAKNITVTIAAGNDLTGAGDLGNITAPACIENATAIGGVNKSDYFFFNRNNLVDLVAPGVYINSTNLSATYRLASGTSMATPHAAAAFALIHQFGKLHGTYYRPSEIENALKTTGKQLNDSTGTGLNYSRIMIYSALLSLNNYPIIYVYSPQNITYNTTQILMNFTASGNFAIAAKWFYNDTGNTTYSSEQYVNVSEGDHKFIFYANDTFGNINSTSINFTSDITPPKNITLKSPTNNTLSKNTTQIFSCNVTDNLGLANISLSIYNSTSFIYSNLSQITGKFNESNFTMNLGTDNYIWFCSASDSAGNNNISASNYTLAIDAVLPLYSGIVYSENYIYNSTVVYWFNSTWADNINISNVKFSFNYNATNQTNQSAVYNSTFNVYAANVTALAAGNYSFQWFANDTANNINSTPVYNFTVLRASPNLNISFNVSGTVYYSDILIGNGTFVNITATANAEGTIVLYINDSIVNSRINSISNTTQINATVNATAFYNATQNYSSSIITRWINVELPSEAPRTYKISPANNSYLNTTATFRINATDVSLKNATLYVWNLSSYPIHSNSTDISGMFNDTSWIYSANEGVYLWNARAYDISDNFSFAYYGNYTLTIDTTLPTAVITASSTSIYTDESSTVTCTTSDTNLNLTKIEIDGLVKNSSTSLTNITYVYSGSGGTKTINCTAEDKAGNSKKDAITITATVRPPTGGGTNNPPGGGTPPVIAPKTNDTQPVTEAIKTFGNITANVSEVMYIPSEMAKEGILSIEIVSAISAENVEIKLKKVDPSIVAELAGDNVYNYFNITLSNLNDTDLKNITINFEVTKQWIDSNGLDNSSVRLKRYKESWSSLDTVLLSEDSDKRYYQASSPGFSLFAITAEKAAAPVPQEEEKKPLISKTVIMIMLLIICIIALAALVYFAFFKKKEVYP